MLDDLIKIQVNETDFVNVFVDEPESSNLRGEIILCPAFGATAHGMFPFSFMLAINGFRVYRIDFRNHVGTSQGIIEDATLHEQAEDIEAVIKQFPNAYLVSLSLSAPPAYRAMKNTGFTRGAVLVTPVVNVRSTCAIVHGEDYLTMPDDKCPDIIKWLGHQVRRSFAISCREHFFLHVSDTISDLEAVNAPLIFLAGDADPWVNFSEVETVHEAYRTSGKESSLITIPAASHRLDRSPVVASRYMESMARGVLTLVGDNSEPIFPTFDETLRAKTQTRDSLTKLKELAEVKTV
ncbi:alpha/beta fold hydrolase [Leptospira weilii]|uniref:alpha/beta fold hydrolase n=1 Tax=Leptospira weilii TaxID=28184 RepID=UPI000774A17A|nr:alpha/beta fold hydrolase [Leptospira weilii]